MNVLEYVLFTLLILVNFCWGLYFSIYERRKSTYSDITAQEVFLGSRRLGVIPLAASMVASVFLSPGLVTFSAHFYAYGWHLYWGCITPLLIFPLTTNVFVHVLYGLGIASIFERAKKQSRDELRSSNVYRKLLRGNWRSLGRDQPNNEGQEQVQLPDDLLDLTSEADQSIEYLAGYVVSKLLKRLHCENCRAAPVSDKAPAKLISLKNFSESGLALVNPSPAVVEILKVQGADHPD
ncbi:hypothetical protein MRX96_059841 [Rhipicephalus microplus]